MTHNGRFFSVEFCSPIKPVDFMTRAQLGGLFLAEA